METSIRLVLVLTSIIASLSSSGASNTLNDERNQIVYYAFQDSIPLFVSPDESGKPIGYLSWRDKIVPNGYFVVHITDRETAIKKLPFENYLVKNAHWNWACIKTPEFDSIWMKGIPSHISLKDSIVISPSGKFVAYHRFFCGEGGCSVSRTVVLDLMNKRISPEMGHQPGSGYWLENRDIMLFESWGGFKRKDYKGRHSYEVFNYKLYMYDVSLKDTINLGVGISPAYSATFQKIIYLKEDLIDPLTKRISLCEMDLESREHETIKVLDLPEFGVRRYSCATVGSLGTSKINILWRKGREEYSFNLFYIIDCSTYDIHEKVIVDEITLTVKKRR